jgi:hypothetical protein
MGNRRKEKIKEVLVKWKAQKFKGNKEVFSCGHSRKGPTYWAGDYKICAICALERNKVNYLKRKKVI